MKSTMQLNLLLLAIVLAAVMGVIFFSPAFAGGVETGKPVDTTFARPPHQDPPPPPPTPPPDDDDDDVIQNIFQTITQTISFPFVNLVEALQNAIESILRAALEPIQAMFEAVLSLWLENPGILSSGNAALPGWDLMRDAWQFMYSIAIAFWPLTLAVVAAIAAKDAVAASTWGLGDLKSALGTWFAAVLLSATSLWWMDLANNLSNAITSYILYSFAGPQFFPGTFMVFFSTVLPGLFLAFPLAGFIIILFLVILAITIFVGLTFGIIARLVLMYLLVALGPLAIILGVLPPLRFVTHMWLRGFLLVLVLGPVDALLLKLAFNVAQYASSAPPLQAAAAFIGVFGLLSILITINFTVVKGVFGAVIAVANQTMSAVKTVGQMVVAGALLMTGAGAGAGIALGGGGAAAGATAGGSGGGGAGGGGAASALGGASAGSGSGNTGGGTLSPLSATGSNNNNGANGNSGNSPWRPSARGMSAAGNYLQSTRGPLAGFGALLRAAGVDQMQNDRGAVVPDARTSTAATASRGPGNGGVSPQDANSPLAQIESLQGTNESAGADVGGAAVGGVDVRDAVQASGARTASGQASGSAGQSTSASRAGSLSGRRDAPGTSTELTRSGSAEAANRARLGTGSDTGVDTSGAQGTRSRQTESEGTNGGIGVAPSAPPRRVNPSIIEESRASMGFELGADVSGNENVLRPESRREIEEMGKGIGAADRGSSVVESNDLGYSADTVNQNIGAVGGGDTNSAIENGEAANDANNNITVGGAALSPTQAKTGPTDVSDTIRGSRARSASGQDTGSVAQSVAASGTGASSSRRARPRTSTELTGSEGADAANRARLSTGSDLGIDAGAAQSRRSRRTQPEGTNAGLGIETSVPPRHANPSVVEESRAATGFDSSVDVSTNANAVTPASGGEIGEMSEGRSALDREHPQITSSARHPDEGTNIGAQNISTFGSEDPGGGIVERGSENGGENVSMIGGETLQPVTTAPSESVTADSKVESEAMPLLSPEADRTLSMLPEGSDEARWQAAQLVSSYPFEGEQAQTAMALEQAMHTANEQNRVEWSQMGTAMEHGLLSTREAANNGIGLSDMARQMEPFTGSRDPTDYLAWQIAGHGDQFQLPAQQVAYLPAPGPYDYQAGHYVEQQLGMAISHKDAAQVFYVVRDPSTPGGGWSKAQQFVGEVNRISRDKAGDPLVELDRWMQTNAPTRARLLWNMHLKVGSK